MATENEIRRAIEKIAANYPEWTIGVTDDPTRRKEEHGDPDDWHHWDADSEEEARNVESHFIEMGMKGGTGGQGKANYVYIF